MGLAIDTSFQRDGGWFNFKTMAQMQGNGCREEEKEFNRKNPDPDALTPKSPEVQKLQAIVDELEDEAKKPDRRCSSGVRWSRDADGRKIPGEKCDGSELFVDGMPAGKYKRAKDALMAAIKAGK